MVKLIPLIPWWLLGKLVRIERSDRLRLEFKRLDVHSHADRHRAWLDVLVNCYFGVLNFNFMKSPNRMVRTKQRQYNAQVFERFLTASVSAKYLCRQVVRSSFFRADHDLMSADGGHDLILARNDREFRRVVFSCVASIRCDPTNPTVLLIRQPGIELVRRAEAPSEGSVGRQVTRPVLPFKGPLHLRRPEGCSRQEWDSQVLQNGFSNLVVRYREAQGICTGDVLEAVPAVSSSNRSRRRAEQPFPNASGNVIHIPDAIFWTIAISTTAVWKNPPANVPCSGAGKTCAIKFFKDLPISIS
jgi:hypothetical protein